MRPKWHKFRWLQYSNHLNTEQVWYSNDPNMSGCQTVWFLNGGLNTGQKMSGFWVVRLIILSVHLKTRQMFRFQVVGIQMVTVLENKFQSTNLASHFRFRRSRHTSLRLHLRRCPQDHGDPQVQAKSRQNFETDNLMKKLKQDWLSPVSRLHDSAFLILSPPAKYSLLPSPLFQSQVGHSD